MNPVAKGNRLELMVCLILEAHGYVCHRSVRALMPTPAGMRTRSHDFFGCIDIVAKRAGEPVRWIQVTSDESVAQKRRDLAVIPWDSAFEAVEIWQWHGTRHGKKSADGTPYPEMYFQVYKLSQDFAKVESNRVFAWPEVRR